MTPPRGAGGGRGSEQLGAIWHPRWQQPAHKNCCLSTLSAPRRLPNAKPQLFSRICGGRVLLLFPRRWGTAGAGGSRTGVQQLARGSGTRGKGQGRKRAGHILLLVLLALYISPGHASPDLCARLPSLPSVTALNA